MSGDEKLTQLLSQLEQQATEGLTYLDQAREKIAALEAEKKQLEEKLQRLETQAQQADRRPLENPISQGLRKVARIEAAGQTQLALEVVETDPLSPHARLDTWFTRYPKAFFRDDPRPLKIGIHDDLRAQEGVSEKRIHRALAGYVKLPRYLRCLKAGAERLDLDGQPVGKVTEEEAEHARLQLEGQRKKNQPPKSQPKRPPKAPKQPKKMLPPKSQPKPVDEGLGEDMEAKLALLLKRHGGPANRS